jgi:hypothetical protein
MKTRPILFSPEMVKAVQDDRKTMTRRICKHQYWSFSELLDVNTNKITQKVDRNVSCPYGKIGDVLWVKETFYAYGEWIKNGVSKNMGRQKYKFIDMTGADFEYKYSVEGPLRLKPSRLDGIGWYKRNSIFMPKKAARLFLMIKDMRVERLQDISEKDAIKEGTNSSIPMRDMQYLKGSNYKLPSPFLEHQFAFLVLWAKINGVQSWDANPWVWVISFERIGKPEGF